MTASVLETQNSLILQPSEIQMLNFLEPSILKAISQEGLTPAHRRERIEQVAHDCLLLGTSFIGRFWLLMSFIKNEGLWKTATDHNGKPFSNYNEYVRAYAAEQYKEISERTVFSMMGRIDALAELGVEVQSTLKLISGMPSVTQQVLSLGQFDAATGAFKGLNPGVADKMREALGVPPEEEMKDKTLLREFAEHVADAPTRRDARALAEKVAGKWQTVWGWNARERVLTLRGWKRGPDHEKFEVRFRLETDGPLHPEARKRLLAMGD